MKKATGLGLLASAFAPLAAVLALVRLDLLGWVSWGILAVCLSAVVFLWLVLRSVSKIQERTVVSTVVRRADERVVGFTSSYVAPVVVAVFGTPALPSLVATLGLFVLMVMIYLRAGLYHLNPTLALIGYRLYEVTADNGEIVMVLTRARRLPQRGEVHGGHLSEDIVIQRKGRA
ncbi:MAG: hypothetical protein LBI84_06850 [Propionibacteriaceae bacterium]|nr:hypothetical protein [Propionibacteriaceae bacterium]